MSGLASLRAARDIPEVVDRVMQRQGTQCCDGVGTAVGADARSKPFGSAHLLELVGQARHRAYECVAHGRRTLQVVALGDGVDGAVLAPQEAEVDSQALCRALAVAFVRAGGQVLSNEAAVRFEYDGRRVTGVATPFGVHRADVFVLAMGAWSSRIEGLPREAVPPITPVKGEIVVLTPPPGNAIPNHVIWGNGIYAVPRGGRLLVGATTELAGFHTILTQTALRWLYRQSTGLMPGLASWHLAEHWAGLRPASPDGLPLLGQTAVEGLYVASGQFRNGILFAPAVAEGLSRLILDRTAVDPAFDPRRFEAIGEVGTLSILETPHKV